VSRAAFLEKEDELPFSLKDMLFVMTNWPVCRIHLPVKRRNEKRH
jgi:hypothetical protein